jgi:hypothetical protein
MSTPCKEIKMTLAIEAVKKTHIPVIDSAAKAYAVSRVTLARRRSVLEQSC